MEFCNAHFSGKILAIQLNLFISSCIAVRPEWLFILSQNTNPENCQAFPAFFWIHQNLRLFASPEELTI